MCVAGMGQDSFHDDGRLVGLPVVPTVATYKSSSRLPAILGRHLRTLLKLPPSFVSPVCYPLFGKPAYSQQGTGAPIWYSYDRHSDSLDASRRRDHAVERVLEPTRNTRQQTLPPT